MYSFMFLRLQILTLAYAFVFRGKKNPHYSKKVIGVLYNLTQPQGLLFQPVAGNRSAVLCDISILHYLYFLLHRHHLCFR